ncbi:hypothetical protein [Limnohabitans sp.]|jgi:hypothetical protein|nr:hypothetical protein [Limnohabitans sp.]
MTFDLFPDDENDLPMLVVRIHIQKQVIQHYQEMRLQHCVEKEAQELDQLEKKLTWLSLKIK